jgi:EmrB/QacA subfamily drug resistance transporter
MSDHSPPGGAPPAMNEFQRANAERRWWILVVLCTSLIIVIVGNTALNIALPTLARQLGASARQLQWMVDAYGLIFAGLLFTAGALGDRFGRKGALQAGLLVFLAGSLVATFASGANMVIAGRAIMGVGGAFVMPSTLSILSNVFPAHERTKAIAVWAGISGGGAAIGPVASGFLLAHFWWGSVFLVNVPIILTALIAGQILLPTSRDSEQARLDVVGALLSIATMVTLVYAIIEAPASGWGSATTLLRFALAIVFGIVFIWWERRAPKPMLDLALFRDRRFSVASSGMSLVYFAMFGVFFLMTQYFQLVLGYSTLTAGISQFPFALVMMAVAPQTPRLAARHGAGTVVATGLGLVALGLTFIALLSRSTSHYWQLLPIFLVLPAGMALTMSPLTAQIMSAVPLGRAGVGSAMNDTTRELGGALGVAVLGSLVASRFTSHLAPALAGLPADVRRVSTGGLASALGAARGLGGESGAALAHAAKQSYMSGFHTAAIAGAGAALVASVCVYRLLPRPGSMLVPTSSTPASPADEQAPVTLSD